MNIELSPEITRTCSNTHGKIASYNNSDFAEITSRCNVQSYQTTCYRNLSWQTKAWHESTKGIDQNTLTDHKPKRTRKYDGTHVNIASFVNRFTKQSMALIKLRRHLRDLDALTTEQCMTNQAYLQQDGMFMKLSMARKIT